MSQRSRRTAASAARDAISTAARLQSALIAEQERERVGGGRRGLSKRVSYVEVPVDEVDPEGEGSDVEGSGGVEGDVVVDGQDDVGEELETGSISSEEAIASASRGRVRSRGRGRARGKGRVRGKARSASNSVQRTNEDEEDDEAEAEVDGAEDDDEAAPDGGTPSRQVNSGKVKYHKVKGVTYEVIDDEIEMEEDPRGEQKIDAKGRLLGGREYKVWTLHSQSEGDPERIYALSIDVARAVGFADSSFLLRRLPLLVKIQMSDADKEQAADAGRITMSMKSRLVTMIPMRNVFKYLGAKIVKNGRYVTDDYYEEVAREECAEKGIEPGTLVPDKPFLVETDSNVLDARQPERSVGAPFYVPGGPTTHWGGAGWNPWYGAGMGNKRARLQGMGLTRDNWMWRMASEAREREKEIRLLREERLQDFAGERLSVYAEQQVGEDTKGASAVKSVEPDQETLPEDQRPAPLRPIADDTAGIFDRDPAFRKVYRRQTGSKVFDPALFIAGAINLGQIVVETETETASRKRKRAVPIKAGEYRGFYEPHTNIPHVRQDLQPTRATMEKTALLPQVETKRRRMKWDPEYTFASTMTLRRIGPSAAAIYSLDYAFSGSDEGAAEIAARERQVREAVEWDRQRQIGPAR
ncbi:hypothetical protein NliqN6_5441 [Naganishia liquefaciens]|uniref:Uncharacterized protein n=1 Tax=Naganishia liquefaciens TaxID=104408 RepID=A0A8H3TXR0_9TREE|nr:hypothetical protein NliqN6_5441 [Naganishia liquefaciens]